MAALQTQPEKEDVGKGVILHFVDQENQDLYSSGYAMCFKNIINSEFKSKYTNFRYLQQLNKFVGNL